MDDNSDRSEQMALTPQDIQSKQFPVRFRGFDVEEVDAFLEQVAEQYMMLQEENKTLQLKCEALQGELDALKHEENSFKDAIISAQKVADEMKRKSRDEANELLLAAQEEVKSLKDEANREVAELERKVDDLRGMQARLHDELKATIARYLEQIESTYAVSAGAGEVVDGADGDGETVGGTGDEPGGTEDPAAAEAGGDEPEDAGAEAELAGLYEKIDLDDLDTPPGDEEALSTEPRDRDDLPISADDIADKLPSLDLDQDEPAEIPDNLDDVMFTLDDPLDKDEVVVPIAEGGADDGDERR